MQYNTRNTGEALRDALYKWTKYYYYMHRHNEKIFWTTWYAGRRNEFILGLQYLYDD